MTFRKTELYSSFTSAAFALEQAIKDGWKLDPEDPPADIGFRYELVLVREDEPVVKPTRAEILAKARQAKEAKRQESGEE